ncbi:MAG: GvpL/GvpF family gas vesicle protein [Terriglobales bacterium]
MPYLLYCVTDDTAELDPAVRGVHGDAVESMVHAKLRCFYSALDAVGADLETQKREALEFHQVTRSLLAQATIIPFRFPTVLPGLTEIGAHLEARGQAYNAALHQLRNLVQMEIRIEWVDRETPVANSGTQYLKNLAHNSRRMEDAVATCRATINELVIDFQQHEFSHGVRCFVLIKREAVQQFQDHIKQIRLERSAKAAVSGPWPPTEFLPDFA